MTYPAQHSSPRPFSYDAHGALGASGDTYFDSELMPGERIGRPLRRRRGKLYFVALLLLAFGAAWGLLGHPATWPVAGWADWAGKQVAAVSASFEHKTPPVERASSAVAPAPKANIEPAKLEQENIAPSVVPAAAKIESGVPDKSASLPPDKASLEPLPPIVVDRADPYQVRAEALGLHPGLSRVVLVRLSETDYRNAGIAIKTALAETADDAAFLWPRQRTPELALFKVHFVPGATSDCRRYVVTITKDGWVTTALPMERCGAQVGRLRRSRQAG